MMNPVDLGGKVALVSVAAKGFVAETARPFAKYGGVGVFDDPRAAPFLVFDLSGGMTGAKIVVDGGMTIC